MKARFVSTIAVIAPDPGASRALYRDAIGVPLAAGEGSDYFMTIELEGVEHFAIWPLAEAAEACFGSPQWPADRTVPQISIEFEVEGEEAVAVAVAELAAQGFEPLHPARTEPWGQTVARVQAPEGAIVGISFIPSMHDAAGD